MINTPWRGTLLGDLDGLGDATRIRLLHLLDHQESSVADLCYSLQLPQSTVSRHLKILVELGWLEQRRQGTARLYRRKRGECDLPAKLWSVVQEASGQWLQVQQDQRRMEQLLLRKRSQTQQFFAGTAAQWDRLRQEMYGGQFVQEAFLALLPRSWSVADLGCGTGQLAERLAPQVHRLLGIDQSEIMLQAARARCTGMKNVQLQCACLEALPLCNGCMDAALMLLVLSYLPQPRRALDEMNRILRPGGRAVVIDLITHEQEAFRQRMGQHWPGFEARDLQEWLQLSGFGNICIRVLPAESGARGPELLLASAERPTAH